MAGTGERPSPGAAAEPVVVSVAEARTDRYQGLDEVVGSVRARVRVAIEAKVAARIEEVPVSPGTSVRKGDVLVRLDDRELRARVESAQAMLDQAEREWVRFGTLLRQEAVTKAEFDAVEARARVARGTAAEARTMLGHAIIAAPWDGVVTRKLAEAGDVALPSRALLELEDPRTLRFEADFPESLVNGARVGDRLSVRLATTSEPLMGVVGEIEPTADPVSRTFRVKLDLPATTNHAVRTGLFGRVSVPTGDQALLAVPVRAVVERGQLELAFVVVEGRARLRLVRTGKHWADRVEILSGLDPGESVVIAGGAVLQDGQPVQVRPGER